MKITRNPHDADYVYDFNAFSVRVGDDLGEVEISHIMAADDVTGEVHLYQFDRLGKIIEANGASQTSVYKTRVVIEVPAVRSSCSPCQLTALRRRARWW